MTEVDWNQRIDSFYKIIENCTLCPHQCQVNRKTGDKGKCKLDQDLLISSVQLHFGEERPLVGRGGSGTIFFSGCNLKCIFCQNYAISHHREGVKSSSEKLAYNMTNLQKMGAHNINLVTPTHQTHAIVAALKIARDSGLTLPIVYNCGGYESVDTLRLLDGIVDIYMPDFKYFSNDHSLKYSKAEKYATVAQAALVEMHRQVGDLFINHRGIAERGLLIRHLVLPNNLAGTYEALHFIAREISKDSYVNVMGQYRPMYHAYQFRELNRLVSLQEMEEAVEIARALGLTRGLEAGF